MTPKSFSAIACCLALAPALPALAQASKPVATHTDWSVFVAGEPKECYIVSPPKSSTAKRDGKAVEVDRGDIRLFVTFRPAEKVVGEVSFNAGYPFRSSGTVDVKVGGETFGMNPGPAPDAQTWAWPASPAEDAKIVSALKRGSSATVTGVSARGTTTVDTFSLSGFTAAVGDAEKRCG